MSSNSKMSIVAVQTVVPTRSTDPRESSRLMIVPQNFSATSILNRRFHVLLCYDRASEDSGWLVAGWTKESLGKALSEKPMFAGRLRRQSEEAAGGYLEIVSDDSGARLIEANVEMKLADFMALKGKSEEAEAELVFWEDVEEHSLHFSPLFYVQITNFSCGGYSIGISCSLLLTDPFAFASFIKRWAYLHKTIVPKIDGPKIPIFYLPNLGKPITSFNPLISSNANRGAAESVLLKIPTKIINLDNNNHKNLAAACIDEAEQKIGRKTASEYSLFARINSKDVKVENYSRKELVEKPLRDMDGFTFAALMDELGLDEICFGQGNEAAHASCWINSVVDEGSVVIISSDDVKPLGVLKILVSFS